MSKYASLQILIAVILLNTVLVTLIGIGVLECITKQYLYRRFSRENEGFMTEKKIALVKNESIGKIAYDMGLLCET